MKRQNSSEDLVQNCQKKFKSQCELLLQFQELYNMGFDKDRIDYKKFLIDNDYQTTFGTLIYDVCYIVGSINRDSNLDQTAKKTLINKLEDITFDALNAGYPNRIHPWSAIKKCREKIKLAESTDSLLLDYKYPLTRGDPNLWTSLINKDNDDKTINKSS